MCFLAFEVKTRSGYHARHDLDTSDYVVVPSNVELHE